MVLISTKMLFKANCLYRLTKKMDWKKIIGVWMQFVRFGACLIFGFFSRFVFNLEITLRNRIWTGSEQMLTNIIGVP